MVISVGAEKFKYIMDSGPFKLFRKIGMEEYNKDQLQMFCNCGEPCPCDEADGHCPCGDK